jgi:hypothetical protein
VFTVRYETTHTHLVIMCFAIKTENRQRIRTADMSFIPFHYSLLFFCLSTRFLVCEFIFSRGVFLPAFDTAKLQAAPREEIIHFVQMARFLRDSDLYTQVYSFQSSTLINFVAISTLCIKIQHTMFRGLDRSPSSGRWKGS